METRLLIGGIAVLSSFGCLFALVCIMASTLRRRQATLAVQGGETALQALVLWRLHAGFALLSPAATWALNHRKISDFICELQLMLESRRCTTTPEGLITTLAVALTGLSVLAGILTGGIVGAVAVPVCCAAVLSAVVGNQADKRKEAVRDTVPAALEAMSACFGSGFTLLQTFQQVAQEVSGPLGETFGRASHVLEMGGSTEAALQVLRDGSYARELSFVAVALDVQHQSGGAMRQVLAAASDTVKGELSLRRSLRVQTAQAKLSARVVAIMPFILVAAFSLASPDFLSPFFESPVGYALLTLALAMQVGGIALVRRALVVDGAS